MVLPSFMFCVSFLCKSWWCLVKFPFLVNRRGYYVSINIPYCERSDLTASLLKSFWIDSFGSSPSVCIMWLYLAGAFAKTYCADWRSSPNELLRRDLEVATRTHCIENYSPTVSMFLTQKHNECSNSLRYDSWEGRRLRLRLPTNLCRKIIFSNKRKANLVSPVGSAHQDGTIGVSLKYCDVSMTRLPDNLSFLHGFYQKSTQTTLLYEGAKPTCPLVSKMMRTLYNEVTLSVIPIFIFNSDWLLFRSLCTYRSSM